MLLGYLARCLFAARRGLAPGRADAHRIRPDGPRTRPVAAPTAARSDYPYRPGQPVHQHGLPRAALRLGRFPATATPATPTTMLRLRRAGVRSKPSCCPLARPSPPSKKPASKWPTTSIPISSSTAATPPWATAPRTSLNKPSPIPYLSHLSIFTRPPQIIFLLHGETLPCNSCIIADPCQRTCILHIQDAGPDHFL